MNISVLTASLPERGGLLGEACESVARQTLRPVGHHIAVDYQLEGAAILYNRLALRANSEWVTFLDDDDLMHPNHLEVLAANSQDVDVVYTQPRNIGHGGVTGYHVPFSAELLRSHSIVPITAMVRTAWFWRVKGFPLAWGYDWRLWQNLADQGAIFRSVPETTWDYRRGSWPSQSHGELAQSLPTT